MTAEESTGRLFLWLARLFTHCNLPQGDFQLLDFGRHVTGAGGVGAAQMGGQLHEIQTKTHFIECFFVHSTEIG